MADSRDDVIIAIRSALLKKGAKQKFSLFFLIILSILIITLDKSTYKITTSTRAILNDFVYQITLVASGPGKFIKHIVLSTKIHFEIYDENKDLKNKILFLKKTKINSSFLKTENRILKNSLDLSNSKSSEFDKIISAKVTNDYQSPFLKSLLLSKGKKDGIMKGMPVFSGNYLLGVIIETNYLSSRVLLITDLNSKIPVFLEKTGTNAILSGTGKKLNLVLDYLPDNFELDSDLIIFTSGKGGFLEPGIAVAQTYSNKNNKIIVKSLADPSQASIVYVGKPYTQQESEQ